MKLIEQKNIFTIDWGAPTPTILAKESKLLLLFYGAYDDEDEIYLPKQKLNILTFHFIAQYTWSSVSNENIYFHPYSSFGLESCGFYILEDSDEIKRLKQKINAKSSRWDNQKHFILTFYDSMFECIAENYEVEQKISTIQDEMFIQVKRLIE